MGTVTVLGIYLDWTQKFGRLLVVEVQEGYWYDVCHDVIISSLRMTYLSGQHFLRKYIKIIINKNSYENFMFH